eukprot:1621305-Prymnesium_polylepis.1
MGVTGGHMDMDMGSRGLCGVACGRVGSRAWPRGVTCLTAAAWNVPIVSVNSATVSILTWASTTCHIGGG